MKSKRVVDLRGKKRLERVAPPAPHRESYSPPKRKSALRKKRMLSRVSIVISLFIMMLVLFIGLSYESHMPAFTVHTVAVSGTETLSAEDVRLYAQTLLDDGSFHIFPPNNVFLFRAAVIERAIRNFYPVVKSAKVTRDSVFSTKANVVIEERKPYAMWCGGESSCFLIDNAGFLFQNVAPESPRTLETAYMFTGDLSTSTALIGNSYAAAHFQGITAFLNKLGQAGFSPLGARVENGTDFSVPLHEGYYIKASYGEDATDLINNLKLILGSESLHGKTRSLQYVDLRFGNRAYYKLVGDVDASSTSKR